MSDTARTLERLGIPISEEQRMVGEAARDFATRRLAPGAAERDRTGAYPIEAFGEAAALGLHAMKVPTDDGGGGMDNVGFALALEGVAESCASVAVILASSNLTSKILSDHGTAEQKRRWLRPYCEGVLGPASFALSEPGCGSDASALATSARQDGRDWLLSGEKMWITSATHAGLHLVFARTDPGRGAEGISAFVVERGARGLTVGKEEDKLGQRASGTAVLAFEDCRVSGDAMIGPRGAGYSLALGSLGGGRVGIGGLCIGISEAAYAAGLGWVKERRAFGKTLADFQNTQFVLADARTEIDAAWLLTLRAARLLDAGDRASAETSMAKLFASEVLGRVVDKMVQLHGGYGQSREVLVERLYRDARVTRIYEGTSEVQRLVIARAILEG